MEAITTIWNGRAGLAKTYWGYGILGSVIWLLVLSLITPGSPLAVVAVFGLCAYFLVVNVGTWRAAGAYAGPAVWSMLAKVAAVLGGLMAVGTLAVVLVALRGGSTEMPQRQQPSPAAAADPASKQPRSEIEEFLKDAPAYQPKN